MRSSRSSPAACGAGPPSVGCHHCCTHPRQRTAERRQAALTPNQNWINRRKGKVQYLKIVDHSNVSRRGFPHSIVYYRIPLWTRDAAGGEDLVILVHTEGLPTQVLYRQGVSVTQHPYINICTLIWLLLSSRQTHVSIIFLKSKTPAISLAANLQMTVDNKSHWSSIIYYFIYHI